MIIETCLASASSSLSRPRLVRRTALDTRHGLPRLDKVLDIVLAQWDQQALQRDTCALLIDSTRAHVVQDADRLVIDKQQEWELYCKEAKVDEHSVIRADIVLRDELLSKDTSAGISLADLQQQVRNLEQRLNSSQNNTHASPAQQPQRQAEVRQEEPSQVRHAFHSTEPAPAKASAPQFGFQSVDPQPIKPRKGFSYEDIERQRQEKRQSASTTAAAASLAQGGDQSQPQVASREQDSSSRQEPHELTAFERVMARSRMQGEALNRAFGTLQARSAGKQYTEEGKEQEQVVESQEGQQSAPSASYAASQSTGRGGDEDGRADMQEPATAKTDIASYNSRVEDAWQERLKEMGHSSNSGSPYAKLRFGKGKEREVEEESSSAPLTHNE